MREHFLSQPPRYLDFACGTGRILALLSPYCESSVGVDVSASMLDIARRARTRAELIEVDITKDDKLGDRRFDLITAFRFFPNAEPELRKVALCTLASHLSETGILVFNNHRNPGGLRSRAGSVIRWAQRRPKQQGTVMSGEDVRALVADVGLQIQRVYHLGVLPLADHTKWVPQAAVTSLEHALSQLPLAQRFARNLVYVCGRIA